MKKKKNNNFTLYLLLFSLAIFLLVIPIFLGENIFGLKELGILGVFLINLITSASIFLPAPSIIAVGVAGNLYNPVLVALIASAGSSLGEVVSFLLGRSTQKVLHIHKRKIISDILEFVFQKYGWFIILLVSFIPNPFFDGIGILVGLSSFSLSRFLILVFTGRIARNLIIAYLGHSL